MSDVFSKKKRSEIMSKIRSQNNKTTELALLKMFKSNTINGWRRHQPLPGKPDFVFQKERLCVFTDGCFWHGCPKCYIKPRQNAKFWRDKISGNKKRDLKVSRQLRADGWRVCRIWECSLKRPDSVMRRIQRMLRCSLSQSGRDG